MKEPITPLSEPRKIVYVAETRIITAECPECLSIKPGELKWEHHSMGNRQLHKCDSCGKRYWTLGIYPRTVHVRTGTPLHDPS